MSHLDLSNVLVIRRGHGYIAPKWRLQGDTPIVVFLEGTMMCEGVQPVADYPVTMTVDAAAQLIATIGESFRRMGLYDALRARADREEMRAREHWERCSSSHTVEGPDIEGTLETWHV